MPCLLSLCVSLNIPAMSDIQASTKRALLQELFGSSWERQPWPPLLRGAFCPFLAAFSQRKAEALALPRPPARSLARSLTQAEWKRALFPQRLVFLSPSLPAFVCELHEMISMTNRLSACLHFCNNPPDGFQPAWYILENVRSPVWVY